MRREEEDEEDPIASYAMFLFSSMAEDKDGGRQESSCRPPSYLYDEDISWAQLCGLTEGTFCVRRFYPHASVGSFHSPKHRGLLIANLCVSNHICILLSDSFVCIQ